MIHMGVREWVEEGEERLSPHAAKSRFSRGRQRPEAPCPLRTAYQRDRDRIVHSKAFRRLKHKTQVFIAPLGDHYVTRLTHTLEVAQIARTIARSLKLNEDLAEAISLGHDLGHTPFGHVGEEVLDELYPGGFRHYEQSLRVVERLENDGRGLNLTYEVGEGILHHSKSQAEILGQGWGDSETLEGQICKIADIVAYINHDTADAIRAGIIFEDDLPTRATTILGSSPRERINTLVRDMVDFSWGATGELGNGESPAIGISPRVLEAADSLRNFLFERVYNVRSAQEEAERAREVVRTLYGYFARHSEYLPPESRPGEDALERRVVDYVAGMTDRFAQHRARELEKGAGSVK